MADNDMHVISLGAGVQSSAMALMAGAGLIGPMPEVAIFADTQAEPATVYRQVEYLKKTLPFPVEVATKGNLTYEALRVRRSKKGNLYQNHHVPAFIRNNKTGDIGMFRRECTFDFKIGVVNRRLRELKGKRHVVRWIGISVDEAHRMKDSLLGWSTHRYPLIGLGMTRADCRKWIETNGHPIPDKSSCVFCPYHDDRHWQRLKDTDPDGFTMAVQFEAGLQNSLRQIEGSGKEVFLHRSMQPLDKVMFTDKDQMDMFGNDCEGMCGV